MGVAGTDAMTQDEYRAAAVAAVAKLAEDVGIVCSLKGVAKEEDIHQMSVDAYNDACRPGNPREVSVEEIEAIYKSLM
jgi:lactaldehyde reductase